MNIDCSIIGWINQHAEPKLYYRYKVKFDLIENFLAIKFYF